MGEYYLAHHGIKGQRWGVRRFQDESGYLTPAGRARYGVGPAEAKARAKADKHIAKIEKSKTRLGKAWHNEMAYMHESGGIVKMMNGSNAAIENLRMLIGVSKRRLEGVDNS